MATDLQLEALAKKLYPYLAADFLSLRSGYAAGTYTPTYLGATTPGVTTYTTQNGNYLRIGRLVLVWGQVAWTAASGAGNAQISLPFVPAVTSTLGNVRCQAVTFAAGAPEPLIVGNALELRSPATNAATTPVAVEAAGDIVFSIAYQM